MTKNPQVTGFLMSANFYLAFLRLDPAQSRNLILALYADMGLGDTPKLDETTQIVLDLVLPQVHQVQQNAIKRAERSRENGKKGGRPPKHQDPLAEKPVGYEHNLTVLETNPETLYHNTATHDTTLQDSPPAPLTGGVGCEYLQKEMKKSRKRSGCAASEIEEILSKYTEDQELRDALMAFLNMRKSIRKPPTCHALTLLLQGLDKKAQTDAEKIAIVNQSTMHSWQGFYDLPSVQQRSRPHGYDTSTQVAIMHNVLTNMEAKDGSI